MVGRFDIRWFPGGSTPDGRVSHEHPMVGRRTNNPWSGVASTPDGRASLRHPMVGRRLDTRSCRRCDHRVLPRHLMVCSTSGPAARTERRHEVFLAVQHRVSPRRTMIQTGRPSGVAATPDDTDGATIGCHRGTRWYAAHRNPPLVQRGGMKCSLLCNIGPLGDTRWASRLCHRAPRRHPMVVPSVSSGATATPDGRPVICNWDQCYLLFACPLGLQSDLQLGPMRYLVFVRTGGPDVLFTIGCRDVVPSSSQTSTPKVVGRAALFCGMEWALDWFGGVKQQGCGPVIFMKDDGGHFYVCGGIDSFGVDKFAGEERYYDFHLTTCFNSGGVELPGKYKKVSLHLSGFAGYGMNAVALPPFDRSKKQKVVQMVGPIELLKKTPCYKVTGFKVKVDSNVHLSTPFVFADTLREDGFPKPGNTKEKSSKAAKAPSVFSRRAQHRKKASPRNKDEENAEWDTRGVPSSNHCPDGDDEVDEREGKSSEQGAEEGSMRGDATEGDGDERESGEAAGDDSAREDEGGGDEGENGEEEENPEGESSEEEENPGDAEERTPHGSKNKGRDEDSDEEESGGETDRDVEVAGTQASANSRKRKMYSERRRAEILGLGASHTAYVQHLERQLGKPEKERRERPAKNAKKKVRVEGTKEVADSGDEGVGVDPRDHTTKAGKLEPPAFDITTCFFLEYDKDGNAVQRPQEIYVDCTKVLPNPVGDPVQYNVRPLNEMLVVSIMRAMELQEKKGEWDRATWILAPVTEVAIRGQKQWVRVKPEHFDADDMHTYHWYAVGGQHTAEACRRPVAANSPAAQKWGVRSWRARAVYFDDNNLDGYAHVSTFDNTRETRAIPDSFRVSVKNIRDLWVDMGMPSGDWQHTPPETDKKTLRDNYQKFIRRAVRLTADS
ncbi:hypothetical protein CBR_g23603 [Chara braunii]|uniref:Uncharacterized protein n=1 Tax=Chara braunii TaxID=69332 RepID=A0A388L4P5_CHABU|nr:hypothetical protein CBR_g23603 [Chara braunii]|eukprot:GBG77274.1 hypothetical protein CBR_g23603 [Chara braunii]